MFEKFDKKYIQIGTIVLTIMLINLVLAFLFFNWENVTGIVSMFNSAMAPVYSGMVIAYLLNPGMKVLEKHIFMPLMGRVTKKRKVQRSIARGSSIVFSLLIGIALIIGLFMLVIPELVNSISQLVNQLPSYYRSFQTGFAQAAKDHPDAVSYVTDLTNQAYEHMMTWLKTDLLPSSSKLIFSVSDSIMNIFGVLFNFFIGIIISIYLMANKELFGAQAKRITYTIFKKKWADSILSLMTEANQVFGKFISGKILDSLIVGILTFFVMSIFGMPYVVLISVLICVTNIIPFFGQYIGSIPSALLVFLVSPVKGVIFLILIIVIMQLDGNIIGPKILGESIGLGSFWVLFSILIFGSLFGLAGMIVAVPVFALIFRMIKRWSASRLKGKQLPVETIYYMSPLDKKIRENRK